MELPNKLSELLSFKDCNFVILHHRLSAVVFPLVGRKEFTAYDRELAPFGGIVCFVL